MDLEAIAQKLKAALDVWARDNSCKVHTARDPFDVLELLTVGPKDALCILRWTGDEPVDLGLDNNEAGDTNVQAPAEERFDVVIGQGMGLDVYKDWRAFAGKGTRDSLLSRVVSVRAYMLSLVYPDDETTLRRFRYRGAEEVTTPDNLPLMAYRLRFGLVAAILVGDDVNIEA